MAHTHVARRIVSNISAQMSLPHSPMRRHLETRFPHTRPLSDRFREKARSAGVRVPRGVNTSPSIGNAVCAAMAGILCPDDFNRHLRLLAPGATHNGHSEYFAKSLPRPVRPSSDATYLHLCLALGECINWAMGPGTESAHLIALQNKVRPDVTALASWAEPAQVEELRQLLQIAESRIWLRLAALPNLRWECSLSSQRGAIADFIGGGVLTEMKCYSPAGGSTYIPMPRRHAYQLLALALSDSTDEHEIAWVEYYQARSGCALGWELQEYLNLAAGKHVDIARARAEFATVANIEVPRPG